MFQPCNYGGLSTDNKPGAKALSENTFSNEIRFKGKHNLNKNIAAIFLGGYTTAIFGLSPEVWMHRPREYPEESWVCQKDERACHHSNASWTVDHCYRSVTTSDDAGPQGWLAPLNITGLQVDTQAPQTPEILPDTSAGSFPPFFPKPGRGASPELDIDITPLSLTMRAVRKVHLDSGPVLVSTGQRHDFIVVSQSAGSVAVGQPEIWELTGVQQEQWHLQQLEVQCRVREHPDYWFIRGQELQERKTVYLFQRCSSPFDFSPGQQFTWINQQTSVRSFCQVVHLTGQPYGYGGGTTGGTGGGHWSRYQQSHSIRQSPYSTSRSYRQADGTSGRWHSGRDDDPRRPPRDGHNGRLGGCANSDPEQAGHARLALSAQATYNSQEREEVSKVALRIRDQLNSIQKMQESGRPETVTESSPMLIGLLRNFSQHFVDNDWFRWYIATRKCTDWSAELAQDFLEELNPDPSPFNSPYRLLTYMQAAVALGRIDMASAADHRAKICTGSFENSWVLEKLYGLRAYIRSQYRKEQIEFSKDQNFPISGLSLNWRNGCYHMMQLIAQKQDGPLARKENVFLTEHLNLGDQQKWRQLSILEEADELKRFNLNYILLRFNNDEDSSHLFISTHHLYGGRHGQYAEAQVKQQLQAMDRIKPVITLDILASKSPYWQLSSTTPGCVQSIRDMVRQHRHPYYYIRYLNAEMKGMVSIQKGVHHPPFNVETKENINWDEIPEDPSLLQLLTWELNGYTNVTFSHNWGQKGPRNLSSTQGISVRLLKRAEKLLEQIGIMPIGNQLDRSVIRVHLHQMISSSHHQLAFNHYKERGWHELQGVFGRLSEMLNQTLGAKSEARAMVSHYEDYLKGYERVYDIHESVPRWVDWGEEHGSHREAMHMYLAAWHHFRAGTLARDYLKNPGS